MRKLLGFSICCSTLMLTACMVGPNYQKPFLHFINSRYQHTQVKTPAPVRVEKPWWFALHDHTLNKIIHCALRNNVDLEAAAARITQARARLYHSQADFFPSGNVGGSYTTNYVPLNGLQGLFPGIPRHYDQNELDFNVSWEVDLFGRLRRRNQVAYHNMQQTVLTRLGTEVSLAAEIAREYVRLRSLERRIAINRNITGMLQRSYKLNQSRYRAGIDSGTTVTQANALLLSTKALLPNLVFQRQESAYRLDILAGLAPGALGALLKRDHGIPRTPAIPNPGVPSDVLRLRPDVISAEQSLIAATAEIGVQQAEFYPKFTLVADGGLQALTSNPLFAAESFFLTAGPSVTWRLLDFWRIDAAVNEARGVQQERLAEYKSAVLKALNEVQTSLVRYQQNQLSLLDYQNNMKAQVRNLKLVREQYLRGLSPFLDVVTAEREVYLASESLIIARQSTVDAFIQMSEAIGGGALTCIPPCPTKVCATVKKKVVKIKD